MFSFLPGPILLVVSGGFFALNTVFWCVCLYVIAVIRLLLPFTPVRRWCQRQMTKIAELWIDGNDLNMRLTQKIVWKIELPENLSLAHSYLVVANHRSWVDIVALQHVFNRRIPFLRFFLKHQLIYVPFLGLAWWALDFPFMRRHSKEYLMKYPERRGQDMAATRKACERFRDAPISVLNFLEGTRFTPAKHARQESPYKHLLHPKAGGVAFVLEALGEQFDSLLDVTISYPGETPTMIDLFSGRLREIVVRVRRRPIESVLCGGNYQEDRDSRVRVQSWVRDLWLEKDKELDTEIGRQAR